jgi:hypothetical protein
MKDIVNSFPVNLEYVYNYYALLPQYFPLFSIFFSITYFSDGKNQIKYNCICMIYWLIIAKASSEQYYFYIEDDSKVNNVWTLYTNEW